MAVDARQRLDRLKRPDAVVQKREDVARVCVEHVIVAHHVDDGVGAQALLAQFQQVADELPLGTPAVGVGLTVAIEEVLGELENAIARRVVEFCQSLPLEEDVQRRPLERPPGDRKSVV